MRVETYETDTIDEDTLASEITSPEALALIDTLGLSGQKKLTETVQAGGEEVVKRVPYRSITLEESRIFNVILPKHVALRAYKDAPMPLRVLQVAAHAVEFFDDVEVWCPADPKLPDPLLIGWKNVTRHSDTLITRKAEAQCFILARWGDVLEPLDELRVKAARMLTARVKSRLASAKGTLEKFSERLETTVDAFLLGEGESHEHSFWASVSLEG